MPTAPTWGSAGPALNRGWDRQETRPGADAADLRGGTPRGPRTQLHVSQLESHVLVAHFLKIP